MSVKVKDPVCGMEVDADKATLSSEHMGKSFYFCSENCKEAFEMNPMHYMTKEKKEKKSHGCC